MVEVVSLVALFVAYVALSRLKFNQMRDPALRRRMGQRETLRERHTQNQRRREKLNSGKKSADHDLDVPEDTCCASEETCCA